MRNRSLWIATSLGAVLLGLPYLLRAFGPTEAEVAEWGCASIGAGLALLALSLALAQARRCAAKAVLGLAAGVVALMQLPPIVCWFVFHGTGISDGSPPSAFVAHWAYAIPHVALFAVCALAVYDEWRRVPGQGPRQGI